VSHRAVDKAVVVVYCTLSRGTTRESQVVHCLFDMMMMMIMMIMMIDMVSRERHKFGCVGSSFE
jgi:hypothetical protein